MSESKRYLICTDLDRTLIPNGPQPESPGARAAFAALVAHPKIVLAYVSGRHRTLVANAIASYALPQPDFVVGDVGTTIYRVENQQDWQHLVDWEDKIAEDWNKLTHAELKRLLADIPALRLQGGGKQNRHKLSYYVPLQADRSAISALIRQRLEERGVKASLVWSTDEPAGIGLLDVLPAGATKFHAVSALMERLRIPLDQTVFCGDSGNDIEVLVSPVPAVLVANAQPEVRAAAQELARQNGNEASLYCAGGGFGGMNGNYSAGILEGIAHFHPALVGWMGVDIASGGNNASR
jgi:sucrose-6F-phosphate phosphohydrolase